MFYRVGGGRAAMIHRLCCIAFSLVAMTHGAQAQISPVRTGESEIIVTGERVDRSIQETASSVALFEANDISERGAENVDLLLASTPNVQIGSGGEGPTIRGQDSTGAPARCSVRACPRSPPPCRPARRR